MSEKLAQKTMAQSSVPPLAWFLLLVIITTSVTSYEWKGCTDHIVPTFIVNYNFTTLSNGTTTISLLRIDDSKTIVTTSCDSIPVLSTSSGISLKVYEEVDYFVVKDYPDTEPYELCSAERMNTTWNTIQNLTSKLTATERNRLNENVKIFGPCGAYFSIANQLYASEKNSTTQLSSFMRLHTDFLNYCYYCSRSDYDLFHTALQSALNYTLTHNISMFDNITQDLVSDTSNSNYPSLLLYGYLLKFLRYFPSQLYNYIAMPLPQNLGGYCMDELAYGVSFIYSDTFVSAKYPRPYYCACRNAGVYGAKCDYYSVFSLPFVLKAFPIIIFFMSLTAIMSLIALIIYPFLFDWIYPFIRRKITFSQFLINFKNGILLNLLRHVALSSFFCMLFTLVQHLMLMPNYQLAYAFETKLGEAFFRALALIFSFNSFFLLCIVWINSLWIQSKNLDKTKRAYHPVLKVFAVVNYVVSVVEFLILIVYIAGVNAGVRDLTRAINIIFFSLLLAWMTFFSLGYLSAGSIIYTKMKKQFQDSKILDFKFMRFMIFMEVLVIVVIIQVIFIVVEFAVPGIQFGLVYRDFNFYGIDLYMIVSTFGLCYQLLDKDVLWVAYPCFFVKEEQ